MEKMRKEYKKRISVLVPSVAGFIFLALCLYLRLVPLDFSMGMLYGVISVALAILILYGIGQVDVSWERG